jgi:alanyl-tRNA synthetase
MKTSQQIRQEFIDFFVKRHGHTFVPSSPVVPHDDPTLLFTNAGMNQFKPIFLGLEKRPYTRAANTQKCIRAGGKHNDLDDVGRSRRHHTFFEMLGNWSFGDYFKRGAIEMAWELLTKVWGLDPSRLHVSCFEGDERNGVPRDTESAQIWKEVAGLPDDHIHYFGKDNFWEMGDTGPCGPCTEIYIDRTPDKSGGKDVNGEDPRVMEIWNLVFIQFNAEWVDGGEKAVKEFDRFVGTDEERVVRFGTADRNQWVARNRKLNPLPDKHVDTGMGFERITQVLQCKQDNYGIDLFDPFWKALTQLSGLKYTGQYPPTNAADPVAEAANPQLRHDIAFRVIADHIRCLTFALTDGAVPSNEGRGYVLRRILRRAVFWGWKHLGIKDPFLHTLVSVVVDSMGDAFPELKRNPEQVVNLIKGEEVSFGKTLARGVKLFEDAVEAAYNRLLEQSVAARQYAEKEFNASRGVSDMKGGFKPFSWDRYVGPPKAEIDGISAFTLHDTFGFPIDLTRIMAEERGMSVDLKGYQELMDKARELARSGGKEGTESRLTDLPPNAIDKLQGEKIPSTNDQPKYKGEPVQASVQAIWNGEKFLDEATGPAAVILNHTNFYAEMGGQIGDQGLIASATGSNLEVQSTRLVGAYVLHVGEISGTLSVGDNVTATVSPRRVLTQKNHTTTHLANWALREVLGDDVLQKGSLVDPEKLRFDFSHGKSLSDEELGRVETLVTQGIEKRLPVYAQEAPQEQALKINGLRAVFGEKYPPIVRVVSVGAPVAELLKDPANEKWRQYSIEFCGGTHLANAADAGGFVITAEESVSKGIRRIVGLTGDAAKQSQAIASQLRSAVDQARSAPEPEIPSAIAAIQKHLTAPGLPLRAKRMAQAAVTELQTKYKSWEKTNKSQQGGSGAHAAEAATQLLAGASELGGGKLIVGELQNANDDDLRGALDSLRKRISSYGILLGSAANGKVSLIAAVSDDLIAKGLKAGDWIREAAKVAGGGGGGRPQMAQAGGKDPAKLGEALETARKFATGAVSQTAQ